MTIRELCEKEVVQLEQGVCLGRADDLAFDPATARLQSMILLGRPRLFLLASAGVGIGLLPSSVPKYLRPDLCSVPIDGPQWNFSFLLISRRERSRASVRAMFELAEHL